MSSKQTRPATQPSVPWENFVKFLRQLNHDLRNQLNAAELQGALIELFDNAFRHSRTPGPIRVSTEMNGNRFSFLLHEPKATQMEDPSHWSIPLRSIGHGHYNLGLPRARAILEAHGGDLTAEFD